MSTPTTHTRNNTDDAQFLAPETHQRAGEGGQEQRAEEAQEGGQAEPDGDLRFVPLSKLVPSPFNVRKTGGENIDELAMLIDAQGLLQNLVVIPHRTKQKRATDKFEVVAGGRRLRALKKLAAIDKIGKDEEILCRVTSREQAVATSVAENSGREQMSVADTVRAFADMIAAGAGVEDVAVCFGITPLTVTRRLKLANVAPRLFELFRQEQINLDQLMALAISDSHDAQERVWDATRDYERNPSNLRRLLLGREIDASRDAVANFVGLADYEAAGGVVIRDLFADEDGTAYIADPELLHRLAVAKLEVEAEKVKAEGWKWTEVRTSFDYSDRHRFLEAPMGRREAKAKEQVTLDACEKDKQDAEQALEAAYEDEGAGQDEIDALEARIAKAEAALDKVAGKLSRWTPEVMEQAGAVVAVDYGGKLVVHRGLVMPEDKKEAVRAVAAANGATGGGESIRTAAGSPVAAEKPAHSEALQRKLTAHRTKALQVLVAGNTHVALAALAHSLLQQLVIERCYRTDSCLAVTGRDCDSELTRAADDLEAAPAWTGLQGLLDNWRERLPGDADKLLPWLIGQSQDVLLELLALCAALTINTVTAREGDHPSNVLASAVGLDMADWWAPTAGSYLAQVSKEQIGKAVAEAVGEEAAAPLAKLKKAEAVAKAEALLQGTRWLPTPLRPR